MDPMLRLAALTEICTPELKDLVFQHVEDFDTDNGDSTVKAYDMIKEKSYLGRPIVYPRRNPWN